MPGLISVSSGEKACGSQGVPRTSTLRGHGGSGYETLGAGGPLLPGLSSLGFSSPSGGTGLTLAASLPFQTSRLPPWLRAPALWASSASPSSCSWSTSKGRWSPTAVSIAALLGWVWGVWQAQSSDQRWELLQPSKELSSMERRDSEVPLPGPECPAAPAVLAWPSINIC